MRKTNPITDFLSNFSTRQLITAAVIGGVLLVGGAGYLIYSNFYGNIGKITMCETATSDIDRKKVASVTWDQVKTIAEGKMPDLNCFTLESAMKMVAGTARSMGITVTGEFPTNL